MAVQEIYATLTIRAKVEAETEQEALAIALHTGEFEIVASQLNDGKPLTYISLLDYAKRNGYAGSTYPRKLCERGAIPGAVRVGKMWAVPEDTPKIDRRVTSGKYVGSEWHREYRQKRRAQSTEPED